MCSRIIYLPGNVTELQQDVSRAGTSELCLIFHVYISLHIFSFNFFRYVFIDPALLAAQKLGAKDQ